MHPQHKKLMQKVLMASSRNCRKENIKVPGVSLIVAVKLSGILKGKQKLGVNSDKLGGIDFTKFSKLTMCSA